MRKQKGRLIVIEGLDGTGKATQTRLLVSKLKKEKHKVVIFDFPQYHKFFGKLVGIYLRGEFGEAHEVNPYFASVLYALDRWSVRKKIEQALKEGKIVLSNRYSTANFLHQTGKIKDQEKKRIFLKWLEELEFVFLKIPKPNLVLFLKVPLHIGQKMIKKKNQRTYLKDKKHDGHEKSSQHLIAAQKQAPYLIRKFHWQKIECLKDNQIMSKEEIADKIWRVARDYL